jgi:hypothetical protein
MGKLIAMCPFWYLGHQNIWDKPGYRFIAIRGKTSGVKGVGVELMASVSVFESGRRALWSSSSEIERGDLI